MSPSASEVLLRDNLIKLLRDSGIEVIDDVEEGQRVLDSESASVEIRLMGSRVSKRKKLVESELKGRKLTEQQKTVADVFSGKADNLLLKFYREGKAKKIIIRQGNEINAGTKHSLFRHYDTASGYITADDIVDIPNILTNGVRTEKMRGKTKLFEYKQRKKDGTVFTVLTELNNRSIEVFSDFYSNKKALSTARQTHSAEAQANIDNAFPSAKVQNVSDIAIEKNKKNRGQRVANESHLSESIPSDDNSLNIDGVKLFRTSKGDAYGFTSGGKIYIDPRISTAETPIHEYAHLWGEALRKGNPEEWKNVVGLMKQETVIWDDVKKNYPHLDNDDDIADEVLATYSGRQGAKKLREVRDSIIDSEDPVDNKRAALSSLERFRQLLSRLWKDISDLLHIHFTTAEEVADKVMSDLLNGFNPKVVAYSNDITKQQFSGQDFPLGTGKAAESDFYDVIDAMYSDPNFDRTSHLRDRYDIGSTPDWMKSIGISGDYFSLSFKNIKTHQGKDVDHDLTREEWYEVPEAIQHPFLVTKYKGASDRFRLYVNMLHNGHYVAVGIDVKRVNQGKNKPMLDVNSIKTVFAKGTERIADNEIPIAIDKNITPKQQALLHGHNFHEYPTIQELTVLELSIAKIDNISDNDVKKCEKLSEDSRISFQFIGEHGAASLDKSLEQTTRMDNLRIARQMEASNRDALSIKLASGWERGGDGLWRYEIDDSSYLAPSMTKDGTIYKLSDVLSGKGARELFAAYPEMRNFDVVYKQLDNNLSGWYNNGRIYLNNSLSQEESNVTILHEIQHAIQYNEGFSTGANVKDIRSRIANIIDNDRDNSEYAREQLRNWAYFRLARTRLNTYERLIQSSDTTSLSRAIDCYWEAMDAIDNDERSILVNEYSDIDSSDDIAKSGYHVKEAKEELDRLAKLTYDSIPEGNMNSLKLVDKLTNALKEYSDKELYSLVGGEVEARNVERRMNMSLEERHRTLAAETEDVARKDQLFLQDENVVSAINDTDEIIGLQVEKLFNDALNGSFTGKPVSIGKLSQEGKTYLEHLSGLKMKEHVDFVLNPSDLKHIYNDHFGSNEKDSGNNIPLTSIDLRNVYKVLSHPDGVIYGVDKKDGRKLFFFLKKMPTGLYNLAEICSTKKGNLTAKSYYITKKGINQRVMEIKSSLLPTSVTYSGESLSTAKVPQLFESSVKKDEKLSDNTKIRFQLIGEHGAKNLDIADGKSSRIDNLRVAKNMDNAGRDALTIKVVTGWEKGADGKWRYEIMDPQYIDLSPSVQLSNLIKAKNKLPANTRKSLSRYENMSAMTKKQSDNYAALVSKSGLDKLGYHDEEMLREGHGNARLCELLTPRFSSSLFKAYPVLRDIHVNYMPMPFGELGSWNPQTKEIELTSNMDIPSESIRKSLLHEIQHAIQYMEGFCTGSSPEYYEAQLHETSEYQAMMKCKKELESINRWIHKYDSDETLYLRYKENEYSLSVIDKNVIRDAAIRLRKGDTYDDIYQDYLHKSKAAEQRFQEISSGNESPFMKYRRTGGEVEARNTEKRSNMFPDDRRNTLALETEDIPREQQIINTSEEETPSPDRLPVSGSSCNCINEKELEESEGNGTLIKESSVVADNDDNIKVNPDTADNYEEAEEEDDEEEVRHSIHL